MPALVQLISIFVLLVALGASPARADVPASARAMEADVVSVDAAPEYTVIRTGQKAFIGIREVMVIREPNPTRVITRAPPTERPVLAEQPEPPFADAIWVEGHWRFQTTGFVWVSGRYIAAVDGFVFVPPRWGFFAGRFFFFSGFFAPVGSFVRRYDPRWVRPGLPAHGGRAVVRRDRGPYWPVGASSRGGFWPVGARR